MTFGPDEYEKSVQVPIINDSSRERSENFSGNLDILIHPILDFTAVSQATIEILYNDCKT